jgi:hypothetical protein
MTVRAFIVLLAVTVVSIYFADRIARDFAAPGLERTFSVLVIAACGVAPVAWLLGRVGWINSGRLELGRSRQQPRNGGQA